MVSESTKLSIVVTMSMVNNNKRALNSFKIVDFGVFSECLRLSIIVSMNRESGSVPREL